MTPLPLYSPFEIYKMFIIPPTHVSHMYFELGHFLFTLQGLCMCGASN